MSEGNSSKPLVAVLAIGCFVILLCGGLLGGAGYFFVVKLPQIGRQVVQEATHQLEAAQFGAAWRAPAEDATPAQLLPPQSGVWERTGEPDASAIPELGLADEAPHAVYQSAGTEVEVFAYRIPFFQQAALFTTAETAQKDAHYASSSQSRVFDGTTHRMTLTHSPPPTKVRMWWCKDWLFVFKTAHQELDLEQFEAAFLIQVQAAEAEETPELPEDATGGISPGVDSEVAPDAPQ